MTDSTDALLRKAIRAVQSAKAQMESGDLDFAISRAYYAMFYAAEAMLVAEGLQFRKHSGVHAAFGEHFVKTGKFDERYHRWLLDAFDQRIVGDYEVECAFGESEVSEVIQQAQNFVSGMQKYLTLKG